MSDTYDFDVADHDDRESDMRPEDVARTVGEALGLAHRGFVSHHCTDAHHRVCMGNYGGSICRCPCHDPGHDARDFSAVPGQDPYR